jgi:hypothetical protein
VATASSTALASMPRHALRPLRDLPMARKLPLALLARFEERARVCTSSE